MQITVKLVLKSWPLQLTKNFLAIFFFFFFFFEMGKSKRVLVIFANSRNLACIEQEMTWIIGTSAE